MILNIQEDVCRICKYYAVLRKGLEHQWISVSGWGGPRASAPRILTVFDLRMQIFLYSTGSLHSYVQTVLAALTPGGSVC